MQGRKGRTGRSRRIALPLQPVGFESGRECGGCAGAGHGAEADFGNPGELEELGRENHGAAASEGLEYDIWRTFRPGRNCKDLGGPIERKNFRDCQGGAGVEAVADARGGVCDHIRPGADDNGGPVQSRREESFEGAREDDAALERVSPICRNCKDAVGLGVANGIEREVVGDGVGEEDDPLGEVRAVMAEKPVAGGVARQRRFDRD